MHVLDSVVNDVVNEADLLLAMSVGRMVTAVGDLSFYAVSALICELKTSVRCMIYVAPQIDFRVVASTNRTGLSAI